MPREIIEDSGYKPLSADELLKAVQAEVARAESTAKTLAAEDIAEGRKTPSVEEIEALPGPYVPEIPTTKEPGETNTQFLQRVRDAYQSAERPFLSPEQEAAGYSVRWHVTGTGGKGEWRIFNPSGQMIVGNVAPTIDTSGILGPSGNTKVNVNTGATGNTGAIVTSLTGATGSIISTFPSAASANAFDTFKARFAAMGLGSLADALVNLAKSPNAPQTADGYYLALMATDEYKKRFGNTNAMRIANGLPALTEGEIMTAENNIRNTMRGYDLPKGFYDQPEDLQNFIANGFSANEVGDAIKAYQDVAKLQNPELVNELGRTYGIGLGGITAYMMNPEKALPVINAIAQKGVTPVAAAATGIKDYASAAQQALGMGAGELSYGKQTQAFGAAQSLADQTAAMAARYGVGYGLGQTLQQAFGGPQAAGADVLFRDVTGKELSTFGGSSAVDKASLGISPEKTGGIL